MESAVENSSVLIVPSVRYSKNPTTKWDLNTKKLVPGKLYGKRIRKLLNGYYIAKKVLTCYLELFSMVILTDVFY